MNGKQNGFMAFTIRYDAQVNRITTGLGLSEAYDLSQPPEEAPQRIQVNALWDTGATHSVITTKAASALSLISVGDILVNHAGGSSKSSRYAINFYLPNNVNIQGVLASECSDGAGDFDAIIGMDIISMGDLSITNVNQRTCMSWRIPSIATVDYVEEANKIRFSGVGRNDSCPCKSGKKFKHCHGANRAKSGFEPAYEIS